MRDLDDLKQRLGVKNGGSAKPRSLGLDELAEEANDEFEAILGKAEEYAVIGRAGLDLVEKLRPLIREFAGALATPLREIFGKDLAPLIDTLDAAVLKILTDGATMRAKLVQNLVANTGLSEQTCLAVVLASSEALTSAFNNNKNQKK